MPNFAVHFGYVYRRIDNLNVTDQRQSSDVGLQRADDDPRSRASMACWATATTVPSIPGFNLSAAALAAPVVNTRTNLPGLSEFHTIEYSATRRQTGRWSLAASGSIRMNRDNDTAYFGNHDPHRAGHQQPERARSTPPTVVSTSRPGPSS